VGTPIGVCSVCGERAPPRRVRCDSCLLRAAPSTASIRASVRSGDGSDAPWRFSRRQHQGDLRLDARPSDP
jgi:hypothetical protein